MQDPEMRPYGKDVPKFAKKVVDDIKAMKEDKFEMVSGFNLDEKEILKEAISFFEKEIDCEVQIEREGEETYDPEKKARFAAPMRPAIYLE
jgi:leucyl-tRNA synthetase